MGWVMFGVEMGADRRRSEKQQLEKDLLEIPGVVEVDVDVVSLVDTGEVWIIGIADAATLKARLEARIGKPVKILADLPFPPSSD